MDFVTELSLDGELIGPNQLANDPTETERIERTLDRDFDAFAAQLAHRLGQDNEEELGEVATLLRYSVAYINNYNRNGVSDRRELDAWLKVMKASTGGSNEKI